VRSFAIAIMVILAAGPACRADGGFVRPRLSERAEGRTGVSSDAQKGVVIRLEDRTELLILQTTYRGPAEDFGWIIPVPGLPGSGDVFPGSRDFIDWLFYVTQPWTVTEIDVQQPPDPMLFATAGAREKARSAAEGAVADGVVVLRRMNVGDYDAAVLSATNDLALQSWLERNDFTIPDGAANAFGHYVGRGWYFVALRVQPEVARGRPTVADLAPIAVRFPAERLVYPLYISRASSPELTALSLVVIEGAQTALGCDQLRWAWPRFAAAYPPGTSWATLRRELASGPEPRAVCEGVWRMALPARHLDYAEGAWEMQGEDAQLVMATATRLWTLLPRDAMLDLTFGRQGAPTISPDITRRASIRDVFARSPWAALLAGIAFVIAAALAAAGRWLPRTALWAVGAGGALLTAVGVQTVAVIVVPLGVLVMLASAVRASGAATDYESRPSPLSRVGAPEWILFACVLIVAGLIVLQAQIPGGLRGLPPALLVAAIGSAAAVIVLATQAARRSAEDVGERAAVGGSVPTPAEVAAWTGVTVGWAAVMVAVGTRAPAPTFASGDGWLASAYYALASLVPASALVLCAEVAWIVAALTLMAGEVRRWEPAAVWAVTRTTAVTVLLGALGIVAVVPVPGIFSNLGSFPAELRPLVDVLHFIAIVVAVGLVAFVLVAPFTTRRSRLIGQGLATAAGLMALLMLAGQVRVLQPAEAGGTRPVATRAASRLDSALQQLDIAIAAFASDTGCYPARLEDLTARTPPQGGLDASGNAAAVAGEYAGPYLAVLPVDPLTGRRDTWVYEVTGSPMVASGGYSLTIMPREDKRTVARRARRWFTTRTPAPPP